MYQLAVEAAALDMIARRERDHLDLIGQSMLFELQAHQSRRQARGIDGAVDLLHHIRHCADMVLVAMGEYHAAHTGFVFHEIAHIRYHHIDAVHILIGKTHAAIDDKDIPAVLVHIQVLTDLIETAKSHDLQFFCHMKKFFSCSFVMYAKAAAFLFIPLPAGIQAKIHRAALTYRGGPPARAAAWHHRQTQDSSQPAHHRPAA